MRFSSKYKYMDAIHGSKSITYYYDKWECTQPKRLYTHNTIKYQTEYSWTNLNPQTSSSSLSLWYLKHHPVHLYNYYIHDKDTYCSSLLFPQPM